MADGVIDVDAHRAVVEREVLVDGQELQRLRIARERVGKIRRGPRDHLAEDALVAAARDDGEPARYRGAQAAAVIEVMVRDDDVRDLLARHEGVGDVEPRERVGLIVVGLEHHEVIGELDDGAAVAADAHVPNFVGDLRRFGAALGGRPRRRSRRERAGSLDVEAIGIDVEHHRRQVAPIHAAVMPDG